MLPRTIFYITGTIFFIVVILACIMFIRKTAQTAKQIKRILTSKEVEDMITGISSSLRSINV